MSHTLIPTSGLAGLAGLQGDAVQIDPLGLPSAEFAPLTYPRYRPFLASEAVEEDGGTEGVIAVGARLGGAVVGLALAVSRGRDDEWLLLSVAVNRSLRRQGIGTRLLRACESEVRACGCRRLVGNHSTLTNARDAVEALLRRAGWSEPRIEEYRWRSPVGLVEKAERQWAPLLRRARARGFRVALWSDLDVESLERISALTRVPDFNPRLDPFRLVPTNTPELTLVILQQDEPVGWIIGEYDHAIRTGFYSVGYIVPRLQRWGWLIVGIAEAARRQAALFGMDSIGLFATLPTTPEMIAFMSRRLAPVFNPDSLERRFWSEKIFTANGTPG